MADVAGREYSRLQWRCRRGLRELDGVLEAFLRAEFAALSAEDKSRFEALLDLPDPDLYGYLAGRHAPADSRVAILVERIRASLRPRA